jgi:hypothetical protein
MGCTESIHNDTTNPVKVWFQLDGGKCPEGGCMEKALQPGSTTGNKKLQLNLSHQVCVKYAEVAGVQTKTQTMCKEVTSPQFAGQHTVINVGEILDKQFQIPVGADIPAVIHGIDAHSNFDILLVIIPLMLALGLIALIKKVFKTGKKRSKVTFSISSDTKFGEEVKVVGNASALGHWDPNVAAVLQWKDNVWSKTVEVEFPAGDEPLQYKYIIVSAEGQVKEWEPCENHILNHKYGYEHICRDGWGKCDVSSPEHGKCDVSSPEHGSALMGA